MRKFGFTLIELMIVIAIIGILAALLLHSANPDGTFCKGGYKYVSSGYGQFQRYTQVLDDKGHGIKCTN